MGAVVIILAVITWGASLYAAYDIGLSRGEDNGFEEAINAIETATASMIVNLDDYLGGTDE